jgi:osmoprotectant transport system substrate-binding protein
VAAALVLIVGLLAGWRVGAASAGHAGTSTATMGTTVPEPVVTAVTPPARPAEDLPGAGRPTVTLADENIPEQFIIGQLYESALTYEGYKVILTRNLGPWNGRALAMEHGTLDLYPEYLGAWNSRIAHLHTRYQRRSASYAAGDAWAHRHGLTLLPPTPFSDTHCVAVLKQYAEDNHVYSLPQLARGDGIIFGAAPGFPSLGDGLPALEHAYHLHPGYVQPIGSGGEYWWLNSGNVQAADCETTDPSLAGPKYVQLADPKHIFGWGNVVPVTTPHVLKAEGKAFGSTIEKIDALLTQRAMRGLNAEIELGNHSPTAIAYQFLEGNGILPRSRYAPVSTTTGTTTTPGQALGAAPPCACMYAVPGG